jgi:hypothetical protein
MEDNNIEGVIQSTERRGNYIYTKVLFSMSAAEAGKLSKSAEHEAGKICTIQPQGDKESIITFKKKIKHLKKGARK